MLLIACLSLDASSLEDSLRTVDFARNVKSIKVQEVKQNTEIATQQDTEAKDLEILNLKHKVKTLEDLLASQGESYAQVQEYLASGKQGERGSMLKRLLETNRALNSYLKQSSIVLALPSKSTKCSSKHF